MLTIKYSYRNLYNTRHHDKNCVLFRAIYPCIYLTMSSKDLYCRHVKKNRVRLGKGQTYLTTKWSG